MNTESQKPGTEETDSQIRWSPLVRTLVSAIVLLHLIGVFISAYFRAGEPSETVERLHELYRPYLQATFMNHGYAFFSPNPGPTPIVEYELTFDDDRVVKKVFPHREDNFPRLLYHRWFMLSENLRYLSDRIPSAEQKKQEEKQFEEEFQYLVDQGMTERAQLVRQAREANLQEIKVNQQLANQLYLELAKYLLEKHQAKQIVIYSVNRDLPHAIDIQLGEKIDDPVFLNFEGNRRELIRYPLEDLEP